MRIGIVSPWNDCCGIAVHAMLLARGLMEEGHDIVVFASRRERAVGRIPLDVQDEPFVYRNWDMYAYGDRIEDDAPLDLYFDPEPMLEEDCDVLIFEKPCTMPLSKMLEVFEDLREESTTIAIMHEGHNPVNKNFFKMRFHAYCLFDERFLRLYGDWLPEDRTFIIPFPCYPVRDGDVGEARRILDLPEDKKVLLAFGRRLGELEEVMPVISSLEREMGFLLLLMSRHGESVRVGLDLTRKYDFVRFVEAAPGVEGLYQVIHASDAVLLHRRPARYVAVSTTVHLCLGAMRPLVCPDNDFFETFDGEIIKYKGIEELKEKIKLAMDEEAVRDVLGKAREFVEKRTPRKIARLLIEVVEEVSG